MNFRGTLAAATLLALPIAANAQAIDGVYIGGAAGVNLMQSEKTTTRVAGAPGSYTTNLDAAAGPALVVSLGYGFGNGLRAEVEGNYRFNTFSGTGYGGEEQKFGAMFNVLYDFVDMVPYVTPYIGAGIGYEGVQERGLHTSRVGGISAAAVTNTKGSLAYQAIVGAALPIPSMPGLAVTAEYRFMGLTGDRAYAATISTPAGAVPGSIKVNNDYNHTFLVGLRYAFGAAPAPTPMPVAAPVPAAPVSRSYLVFFDWDKAVLTDRARQIVSEAAANSTKVQTTRIEVNGYTDTSGTPKYNEGLSIRRAQAVAAELVKDGVPKAAISIQGFGETHLLVPTGPNVREPQNRRVEIILK